jgi:hypothetical protein
VSAFAFWKTAHILSAAVILGTGFGIAFFTWFGYRGALRSRDIGALRVVLRLTVIADACFTAPAVVFQAASGVVLMNALGWPWVSAWSIAVWALFLLAGRLLAAGALHPGAPEPRGKSGRLGRRAPGLVLRLVPALVRARSASVRGGNCDLLADDREAARRDERLSASWVGIDSDSVSPRSKSAQAADMLTRISG